MYISEVLISNLMGRVVVNLGRIKGNEFGLISYSDILRFPRAYKIYALVESNHTSVGPNLVENCVIVSTFSVSRFFQELMKYLFYPHSPQFFRPQNQRCQQSDALGKRVQ